MKLAPLDVPRLLRRYGLRPDKRLGQNFLVDTAALESVIRAARIRARDQVLEIGAGVGGLTRLLSRSALRVVAVELDRRLIPPLEETTAPFSNIEIIQGDIMEMDCGSYFGEQDYQVVANIPYYITSPLIRHLIEAHHPPMRLTLTVQIEVAQRICADPGDMSLLSLSVQVYGEPQIQAHIPARAFYPPPKVDSAVVAIDLYPEPLIPPAHLDLFFRLAKAGFSQKRKTLQNALAGGMHWEKDQSGRLLMAASIDPRRRAETLSISEWKRLTEKLNSEVST